MRLAGFTLLKHTRAYSGREKEEAGRLSLRFMCHVKIALHKGSLIVDGNNFTTIPSSISCALSSCPVPLFRTAVQNDWQVMRRAWLGKLWHGLARHGCLCVCMCDWPLQKQTNSLQLGCFPMGGDFSPFPSPLPATFPSLCALCLGLFQDEFWFVLPAHQSQRNPDFLFLWRVCGK